MANIFRNRQTTEHTDVSSVENSVQPDGNKPNPHIEVREAVFHHTESELERLIGLLGYTVLEVYNCRYQPSMTFYIPIMGDHVRVCNRVYDGRIFWYSEDKAFCLQLPEDPTEELKSGKLHNAIETLVSTLIPVEPSATPQLIDYLAIAPVETVKEFAKWARSSNSLPTSQGAIHWLLNH